MINDIEREVFCMSSTMRFFRDLSEEQRQAVNAARAEFGGFSFGEIKELIEANLLRWKRDPWRLVEVGVVS